MPTPTPHETWNILDPSKIQCAMDCERQFMFQYVFGWRSFNISNHLHFGTSWHKAMEYLLLHDYESNSVINAFDTFLTEYRKEFTEDTDSMYAPKDPANVLKALKEYCSLHKYEKDAFEVLYTEISGTVPITKDDVLHFRMDSILKDLRDSTYFSLEHKTGSRTGRQWNDQWLMKTQIGTYIHVLKCLYPSDEVKGIKVRGTFFQKTKNQFETVPVYKDNTQMQIWYWNTVSWMNRIRESMDILMNDCSDDDEVLPCFTMNTENCTKYFGCPYHDFCSAWSNPLRQYGEPPMGFKVEYWNPKEEETTNKITIGENKLCVMEVIVH